MINNTAPKNRTLVVGVTVGTSAYSLLKGQLNWFKNSGWNVTLVSSHDRFAELASEREEVSLHSIEMYRGIAPLKDLVSLIHWIRFLREYRPDAVSVGTPKAALVGSLGAWITRVPRRLYVVRGLRLEGTKGLLSWVLWSLEKLTTMLATDVMYVSPSLADEARRRSLSPRHRSWLIGAGSSNGVNARSIIDMTEGVDSIELRAELNFDMDDFIVGFVGRIARDKGIDTFIGALQSPDIDSRVRVLLIGDVEDDELEMKVGELGDRIKLIPWTANVWRYFPAFDVLCLPTFREGFPNVVLEAASAGVPTVTTCATGAIDSVIDGETGLLFEMGSSSQLVTRINELCRDPVLRAKMGENAKHRALTQFSQENIWRGLEEILTGSISPKYARRFSQQE